ncbi:MAG: DUF6502 family protein [Gammaproteobacteria bacterium]
MSLKVSETVFAVILATIRPIVSMLIRFGISYQDFDRVVRAAFVDAATNLGATGSRQPNVSKIALTTGLSRKVVRQVQEQALGTTLPSPEIRSLPAEVLNVWYTNGRFSKQAGVPRELAWDTGPGSFCDLVKSCTASISPTVMRSELMRVGAISESKDGLLCALRRSFVPSTNEERLIQGLQYGIRPLAMTVAHNTSPVEGQDLRFQRIVWNYCVAKPRRGAMDALVTKRLEEFSQEIDDLISEAGSDSNREDSSVFGVGLYHFEDDPTDIAS